MKPKPNDNSKGDRDDLNKQADLFVQQKLESLAQPEPMTPEFVDRLSSRLDAEFLYVTAETSNEEGFCLLYTSPSPRDRG